MNKMMDIKKVFKDFNQLKVLVIGDVMIDSYLYGKVDRISPEAPVPIVSVNKRENRLGGAANVGINVHSLGAKPILCSVIGKDDKGNQFINLLKERKMDASGIVQSEDRITTVKFRVIGNNTQMLRVDEEIQDDITEIENDALKNKIKTLINNKDIDIIIFEDYNKGVITKSLIDFVIKEAKKNNIPVAVDPKKKNFLSFKEATLFKPNLKELREGLKIDGLTATNKELLEESIKKLQEQIHVEMAMITLSDEGIMISVRDNDTLGYKCFQIPAHKRNIADVSGAGDTVISVASLCLALKQEPYFIAALSNLAGGLVCEQVGAVPVNKEKLLQEAIDKLA